MGRELQFEIVCVFKGKSPIYSLCHSKEPLAQCLILLLGKGGCFTSLPYAALSVRGAELRQSTRLQARGSYGRGYHHPRKPPIA